MQTNTENNELALVSAEGPDEPRLTVTAEQPTLAETPSLENIAKLERRLASTINAIRNVQVKKALMARLEEDERIIREAGIDGLDDDKKGDLDREGAKGLIDRQNKTKAALQKEMIELSENEKSEILKQVTALHDMRGVHLKEWLKQEHQKQMDNAYSSFLQYLGEPNPGVIRAHPIGAPLESTFQNDLRTKGPNFINEATGKHLNVLGNTFRSNDPTLLVKGMVAAGYKSISISCDNIDRALETARAAVAEGMEEVTFARDLMQRLDNPTDPHFTSYGHYQQVKAIWDGIQAQIAARKAARTDGRNTVFNAALNPAEHAGLSENAQVFNNLGLNSEAHKDMLFQMTNQERAALAYELSEDPNRSYVKNGIVYTPHDYIRSLTAQAVRERGNEEAPGLVEYMLEDDERKASLPLTAPFDDAYGKVVAANIMHGKPSINGQPAIPGLISESNPVVVANKISNEIIPSVRKELYGKIREMKPSANATEIQRRVHQCEIRTAAIGHAIDRYHGAITIRQNQGNRNYYAASRGVREEVNEILKDTTHDEREQIWTLFRRNYNRLSDLYEDNTTIQPTPECISRQIPAADQDSRDAYRHVAKQALTVFRELSRAETNAMESQDAHRGVPNWTNAPTAPTQEEEGHEGSSELTDESSWDEDQNSNDNDNDYDYGADDDNDDNDDNLHAPYKNN